MKTMVNKKNAIYFENRYTSFRITNKHEIKMKILPSKVTK